MRVVAIVLWFSLIFSLSLSSFSFFFSFLLLLLLLWAMGLIFGWMLIVVAMEVSFGCGGGS